MNTEIELTSFLEDCPAVWRKFNQIEIESTDIYELPVADAITRLNELLKKYHAEYTHAYSENGNVCRRYLKFESEAHKNWFIMKWS
jgi:hypothetical protein